MRRAGLFVVPIVGFLIAISANLATSSVADARSNHSCGLNSYVNVSGHCVHRPVRASRAPYRATAKCRDGSYSFSEHRRGTCSWHGGVATWL